VIEAVNFRCMHGMQPTEGTIAPQVEALAEAKRKGLIKHIGVSNVTATQIKEAQTITPIVCVQNFYNLANRGDDAMVVALAKDGIAYVPFFPLGGFMPLQSSTLEDVAKKIGATPMQTAQAWLLHRSPNILLIPGTSSSAHLKENLAAAELQLPDDAMTALNGIAAQAKAH
jgi:pyridoxine 4-dehydrogenase